MTADVTPIDGREALLALLDRVRADVESGEVTGVAVAASCHDGAIFSAWEVGAPGNVHVLNGAVSHLSYRLNVQGIGLP